MMTMPIIHSNGTSPSDLCQYYTDALEALRGFRTAHSNCAPNGRDYYLVTGALGKAMDAHNNRVRMIDAIEQELSELQEHCAKHIKRNVR